MTSRKQTGQMIVTVLSPSESPNQPLGIVTEAVCFSRVESTQGGFFSFPPNYFVESVIDPSRLSRLLSFYHKPAPLTQTYAGANSRQIQRKRGRQTSQSSTLLGDMPNTAHHRFSNVTSNFSPWVKAVPTTH